MRLIKILTCSFTLRQRSWKMPSGAKKGISLASICSMGSSCSARAPDKGLFSACSLIASLAFLKMASPCWEFQRESAL